MLSSAYSIHRRIYAFLKLLHFFLSIVFRNSVMPSQPLHITYPSCLQSSSFSFVLAGSLLSSIHITCPAQFHINVHTRSMISITLDLFLMSVLDRRSRSLMVEIILPTARCATCSLWIIHLLRAQVSAEVRTGSTYWANISTFNVFGLLDLSMSCNLVNAAHPKETLLVTSDIKFFMTVLVFYSNIYTYRPIQ